MYFLTTSGTARERGRQHGEALGEAIAQAFQRWVGGGELPDEGRRVEAYLQQHCPDACEELLGISEGCGLAYDQVVYLTVKNSLSFMPQACTTFVVRGDDGRCVLGKTQDVGTVEADLQLTQHRTDELGQQAVLVGLVGTVWTVCGMNSDGLAVGINSAPSLQLPQTGDGLPQHSALQPLLADHATLATGLRWWLGHPLVGKGICGCACDAEGDAVVFERASDRAAVSRGAGSLHHTNHYRDAGLLAVQTREGSQNSFDREAYLDARLLGRTFADPVAEARSILTTGDAVGAICRLPDQQNNGTHSAYLADCATRTFHVCDETPGRGEWHEYRLG